MKDKIYNNAKEFNQKGMNYYVEKELKQSIINLSISAELIGKAFLAIIHPSIIVDGDFDSLLRVCGAGKYSRKSPMNIRTIGAREVFKRCFQILPKLRDYEKELHLLADVRNGLVHLGDHDIEVSKQIFKPYLRYTKIILAAMNSPFDDYFGEFSELADANILDATKEIDLEVQKAIIKAKSNFKKRFESLDEKVKEKIIKTIIASYALDMYDEDLISCPACSNDAILSGSHEVTDWEADFDEDGNPEGAYPIVKLHGDSLRCDVCGLILSTSEKLEVAGVETEVELEDIDPADFVEPIDEYWEM